jgi:hypothetical protein
MRPDIKKYEFLGRLGANPPKHISLAVVHAIVDQWTQYLGSPSKNIENTRRCPQPVCGLSHALSQHFIGTVS